MGNVPELHDATEHNFNFHHDTANDCSVGGIASIEATLSPACRAIALSGESVE